LRVSLLASRHLIMSAKKLRSCAIQPVNKPKRDIKLPVVPIYDPKPDQLMRVAGFMSGSGTNLIEIIKHQQKLKSTTGKSPYEVVAVFTDNKQSNAAKIGRQYGISVVENDLMDFYRGHGCADKRDMSLRSEFDIKTVEMIEAFDIDVVAMAGYMSIITKPLLQRYAGRMINVHPADLRVMAEGKRLYVGDRAVALAIKNGEPFLHSTVHLVREIVDNGEILMISAPVLVEASDDLDPGNKAELQKVAEEHQEILKKEGDWVIFPKALELIAQGRYGFDEKGLVHFDDRAVPEGAIIDQLID
jgi:phosphoribosylglycinamide formyltransferase 1